MPVKLNDGLVPMYDAITKIIMEFSQLQELEQRYLLEKLQVQHDQANAENRPVRKTRQNGVSAIS